MQTRDMLLSIDPGGNTGIVGAEHYNPRQATFDILFRYSVPFDTIFKELPNVFDAFHSRIYGIVIERFRLFNDQKAIDAQIGSEFPSCQIIGAVKALATMYRLDWRVHVQDPWQRRQLKYVPPIHYQELLVDGSIDDDIFDAYKHMWYFTRLEMHRAGI